MGCNCCQQFPGALYFLYQRVSNTATDAPGPGGIPLGSTQDAWDLALSGLDAFDDGDPWFEVNAGAFNADYLAITLSGGRKWIAAGGTANASLNRVRYRWAFYTGSCYAKVWWEEFISDAVPAVTSGPTALDWEWATPISVDGLCLPSDFSQFDVQTWPAADISESFVIEPPEPANVTTIGPENELDAYVRKLRPSWVDGYEPPSDGSANGWPVP